MGMFDFFSNIFGNDEKSTTQPSPGESTKQTDQQQSKGGSALPRGRMRETDKVRGPDSPLPHEPGVYYHRNKETGKHEYIGQTNDLRRRQQEHERSGKLNTETQYIQYGKAREDANRDDLLRTEMDKIAFHGPENNKTKGGNGRR